MTAPADHEVAALMREINEYHEAISLSQMDEDFFEPQLEREMYGTLHEALGNVLGSIDSLGRCEMSCGPDYHRATVAYELFRLGSYALACAGAQLLGNNLDPNDHFWKLVGRDEGRQPTIKDYLESLGLSVIEVGTATVCSECGTLVLSDQPQAHECPTGEEE